MPRCIIEVGVGANAVALDPTCVGCIRWGHPSYGLSSLIRWGHPSQGVVTPHVGGYPS
jgi:hypothetical protein